MVSQHTWKRIYAATKELSDEEWNDMLDRYKQYKEEQESNAFTTTLVATFDSELYYVTRSGDKKIKEFIHYLYEERDRLLPTLEERECDKVWLPDLEDIVQDIEEYCAPNGYHRKWCITEKVKSKELKLEMDEDIKRVFPFRKK